MPRRTIGGDDRPLTVILTAQGRVPGFAQAKFPTRLDETRLDFVLDRADDEGRTGLVELTVPDAKGEPGAATGHSLEIASADPTHLRVDIRDITTWAATSRIDARVAPGTWVLRLLPPKRDRVAFEAVVTVAARVTTRAAMERRGP